jgi:hypothetical protein
MKNSLAHLFVARTKPEAKTEKDENNTLKRIDMNILLCH